MNAAAGRLRMLARGVGAGLLLALLLVGPPAVLLAVVGLPGSLPSVAAVLHRLTAPDDGTVFIAAAATVGWLCWLVFAVSTVVEAAALLRHRTARRVTALAGPQRLAAQLLAAVAVLGSSSHLSTSPVVARPAAVALSPDRPPAARGGGNLTGPAAAAPAAAAPRPAAGPTAGSVVHGVEVEVRRGDTLWDIAERHLGDGEGWPRIARANYGRPQPDGRTLTDAHWIYPGWRLLVPSAAGQVPPRGPAVAAPPRSAAGAGHTGAGAYGDSNGAGTEPPMRPAVPAGPGARDTGPSLGAAGVPGAAVGTADPEASRGDWPSEPMLVAFAGGGVLLAGVTLTALLRSRRRQFRHRRPGRSIGTAPPELARTEQAVVREGARGVVDVGWLNAALRALVRTLAPTGVPLPDVVAAGLSERAIRLVLARPHTCPPAPWRAEDGGRGWILDRGDPVEFTAGDVPFSFAPYPTLVTVGSTREGEHWLLDLERIAALSLSGDPQRCLDLARFLAAELAHNVWSEHLTVTLVGFGAEMAALNPDRLRHTEDLPAAVAVLRHRLDRAAGLIEETGIDVLDGRLRDEVGDGWAPHVLLIAPSAAAADGAGVPELLAALRGQPGRTAVALVLAEHPDGAAVGTRWQLRVDEAGVLHVPALGLELRAQQLPAEEAGDLAALLALAADVADVPMPPARGDRPWEAYADAAGAPLPAATTPRAAGPRPAPDVEMVGLGATTPWMDSVLPLPTQAYLAAAATTGEDVETLAPRVPAGQRQQIDGADPGLDADLAAWADRDGRAPKLRVLGPIGLTAGGVRPGKRLPYYTEIVAYLATRPRGATREELGAALHPHDPRIEEKTTVKAALSIVRDWLGADPRTGSDYLLDARCGPTRGVYRIEGLLCDADLFRRLRLRGTARGAAGLVDLQAALDLVSGEPFTEQRRGGYGWLIDAPAGERLDVVYLAMVVDLAHTLATAYLAGGQPGQAISVAQRALTAGASDDIALLDLVAAHHALGNAAEAERYVVRILANHDAEVEEDLPPRTYDVLRRRHLPGHPDGGPLPLNVDSAARG